MSFRNNFVWGAATSAIQIEGFPTADGGGESVWDAFCRKEGCVAFGDDPSIACDSYHRFPEDIGVLKAMGLKHYRFSTSWARLDPNGDGHWNEKGLAYYDALVDLCLENGITPWLTLHHWEMPLALAEKGDWSNRETAVHFGEFAGMMAAHFKGRVKHFFTLNEPNCVLGLGYWRGIHAPGKTLGNKDLFVIWKNMALAHGYAARAIRDASPEAIVGLVSTGRLCYPETEADTETARRETFRLYDDDWTFTHNIVLDPAMFGRLDTTPGTELHTLAAGISDEDWAIMHCEPDVIGLNMYNGHEISTSPDGSAVYKERYAGFPRTSLKWPVTPEIFSDSLVYLYERYKKPLYISECGLSCHDWISLDGKVHDPNRIDFLHRYLKALKDGADKADVRGFFQWSLLDNFEWHSGYAERFGLVYTDYPTGTRILKDSAYWYAQTAASNGDYL